MHFCFADEREATGLPPAAGRQGVNKGNLLSFLGFGEHNFSEIDLAPVSSLTEKTEEKKKDINLAGLAGTREIARFL